MHCFLKALFFFLEYCRIKKGQRFFPPLSYPADTCTSGAFEKICYNLKSGDSLTLTREIFVVMFGLQFVKKPHDVGTKCKIIAVDHHIAFRFSFLGNFFLN